MTWAEVVDLAQPEPLHDEAPTVNRQPPTWERWWSPGVPGVLEGYSVELFDMKGNPVAVTSSRSLNPE